MLRLLKLALFSAGSPMREVHFEGEIGPSYVTASTAAVKRLAQQFLNAEDTEGPRGELRERERGRSATPRVALSGLEKAPGPGKDQAVQAVQAGRRAARFPCSTRASAPAARCSPGRRASTDLRGPGRKRYRGYRMVIKRGRVGEYYGVQGLTWKDPPILERLRMRR